VASGSYFRRCKACTTAQAKKPEELIDSLRDARQSTRDAIIAQGDFDVKKVIDNDEELIKQSVCPIVNALQPRKLFPMLAGNERIHVAVMPPGTFQLMTIPQKN
jgi:hypothetical protein